MKQNIFVEYQEIKGKNKETLEPYHFANVTVSNGLVSRTYNMKLHLVDVVKDFRQGQKIEIEKDEKPRGRLFDVEVVDIKKAI